MAALYSIYPKGLESCTIIGQRATAPEKETEKVIWSSAVYDYHTNHYM